MSNIKPTKIDRLIDSLVNRVEWAISVPGAVSVDRSEELDATIKFKADLSRIIREMCDELIGVNWEHKDKEPIWVSKVIDNVNTVKSQQTQRIDYVLRKYGLDK